MFSTCGTRSTGGMRGYWLLSGPRVAMWTGHCYTHHWLVSNLLVAKQCTGRNAEHWSLFQNNFENKKPLNIKHWIFMHWSNVSEFYIYNIYFKTKISVLACVCWIKWFYILNNFRCKKEVRRISILIKKSLSATTDTFCRL